MLRYELYGFRLIEMNAGGELVEFVRLQSFEANKWRE